jgi:hypothetical protein
MFSVSLACAWLPSAVTTLAERRLSTIMPYFQLSHPKPPPRVKASPAFSLQIGRWPSCHRPKSTLLCAYCGVPFYL